MKACAGAVWTASRVSSSSQPISAATLRANSESRSAYHCVTRAVECPSVTCATSRPNVLRIDVALTGRSLLSSPRLAMDFGSVRATHAVHGAGCCRVPIVKIPAADATAPILKNVLRTCFRILPPAVGDSHVAKRLNVDAGVFLFARVAQVAPGTSDRFPCAIVIRPSLTRMTS